MNICVVGGSGFIGVNLCKRLLELRHSVTVIDMRFSENLKCIDVDNKIHRVVSGAGDDKLKDVLKTCDVLFHLASRTIPSSSNENPVFDIESNLVASVRLISAAKDAGVGKIIFVSSGGTVYGVPEYIPIDESHPLNPVCSYGVNKIAIEKYLRMYQHLGGACYEVFRLSNPYGPFQSPQSLQGVIPVFMKHILTGERVTIWGDGEVVRDFIYIDDVIDVFVQAVSSNKTGQIYNLGGGSGTSINNVLSAIETACGVTARIQYTTSRNIDVPVNVLDIDKICKDYHWEPKISLETGLLSTLSYLKETYIDVTNT